MTNKTPEACYIASLVWCNASFPKSLFLPPVFHPSISTCLPSFHFCGNKCPSFHFYDDKCFCGCPRNLQICCAHVTLSSSIFCLLPVSCFHCHPLIFLVLRLFLPILPSLSTSCLLPTISILQPGVRLPVSSPSKLPRVETFVSYVL